ncbi:hypothetical protein JAAARDRAFT_356249 [Jaapia argillacea MUCL 33604]|uniref:Uncharacterized protein n=1 Tax=Jaapia argillacea MUCL 33604 TaxID=933084 RepID=A0A067PUN1_9AGAM|nr:hypothetical protein JAAARDRAFT_356249 [Jaapia argillacea MUCL 33604]
MAATRQPPPRLYIPPSIGAQQPMAFEGHSMYSPALPTSIQHGFHPPFPLPQSVLQTPMQSQFFPPIPGAPMRPPHLVHHAGRASVAQLAAAGIYPPQGVPMTPIGQNGLASPMILGAPPFPQPFASRNRRTPSVSLGGPPKAALGGPGRNHAPIPAPLVAAAAVAPPSKTKKIPVSFPQETIPGRDGEPSHRADWARCPIPSSQLPDERIVEPPELTTADPHPPDAWRYVLPDTVDVFLPGKSAWDALKHKVIEEKLEKLGVERGSGSTVPHIHAPHARAASVSFSPLIHVVFFTETYPVRYHHLPTLLSSCSS